MHANARLLPLLLCLAGFLSLAECSPKTPAKGPPPRQYDQPSSLEGLTFATPALEEMLQSFTHAIDKIADKKWEQKGWHKETHSNNRYRLWCSEPGVIALLEEPPSNQSRESCQLLRLSVNVGSRESPTEIYGINVRSRWQAPRGKWGALVVSQLGNSAAPRFHSELAFERDKSSFPQPDLEDISANAWLDDYSGHFQFGGVRYVANLRTRSDHNWYAVSTSDLLRWYDSADHFREDWMARLTRLEELAKKDIPSGAAISQGESDKPDGPSRQGLQFLPLRSAPALAFRPAGHEIANVPPPLVFAPHGRLLPRSARRFSKRRSR